MDFDARPIDQPTQDAVFKALADSYDEWVEGQSLFEAQVFDTLAVTKAFFEDWLEMPFRSPAGGSRFNNLLWLHLLCRSYRPDVVIDSGTFEGASAWAMATATPAAVWSYDVDLSQIKHRTAAVRYVESDWTNQPPSFTPGTKVLAYFDDHMSQSQRLLEARSAACTLLVFDDDYPLTSYFHMAPSSSVLPKVEFILDENLRDGQELVWSVRGRRESFTVNKAELDKARECISATERLPFTGLITGIHQTPYRLVRLKSL